MSVRSGTCPQPRTTASAPGFAAGGQPVGAEPHGVGRVGRVGRVGGRDGAGTAPAPAPTAADAPHYAMAPGAYNMQVWWQQERARQAAEAAEAAEEPAEAMEAEEEPAPAALVRERSQDDEGPAAQRARTNPNADDEIDFENATVLGVPKNFVAIDEADQKAMTDDEWAEYARLHAAERAAYPENFERMVTPPLRTRMVPTAPTTPATTRSTTTAAAAKRRPRRHRRRRRPRRPRRAHRCQCPTGARAKSCRDGGRTGARPWAQHAPTQRWR